MNDLPRSPVRASWRRYLWWLVLLLLGILIGWLLAPRCPRCPTVAAPADAPRASSGPGSGTPARVNRKPDPGSPDSGRLGSESGNSDLGSAPGGDPHASDGPGLGSLKGKSKGEPPPTGDSGSSNPGAPSDVAGSGLIRGAGTNGIEADTVQNPVQYAADFRYDKTGLPRYPVSVNKVSSAWAIEPPPGHGYHSSCTLLTSSGFQEVVDWYKAHLPAGWTAQTVGDLTSLGQQVSVASITAALAAAAHPPGAAGTTARAGTDNAAPALPTQAALSVAMFSPPQGMSGDPTIMIRQQAGQPVEITISRRVGDD